VPSPIMGGEVPLVAARVLVLWAWAFCFAALEVEVEGAHGWAERLPTWYRITGPVGGPWSRLQGGRPLTGYHLFMFPIPLIAFHLPYLFGLPWDLAAEALTISTYIAWAITWDYLWFVLNPAYGVAGFRRGHVWWYPGPWMGRFPVDYAVALAISLGLAAAGSLLGAGTDGLLLQGFTLLGFGLLTALAVVASPAYHRWYRRMRRPGSDDRALVHIGPPPSPPTGEEAAASGSVEPAGGQTLQADGP